MLLLIDCASSVDAPDTAALGTGDPVIDDLSFGAWPRKSCEIHRDTSGRVSGRHYAVTATGGCQCEHGSLWVMAHLHVGAVARVEEPLHERAHKHVVHAPLELLILVQ